MNVKMYQIYYLVDGVPFVLNDLNINEALKHCELLEKDEHTNKYELTQIIKTYERKNNQNGHKANNNTGNKYQDTYTCKKDSCRYKQICRQLHLFEL